MSPKLHRVLLAAASLGVASHLHAEMVVRFTFDDSSLANLGTLGGSATVEGTSVITAGDGLGFGGTDGIRGNSAGNLVFESSNFLNLGNLTLSTRIQRGDTATWQDFWGLGTNRNQAGNFLRLEDNGSGYALYKDGANPDPQVASGGSWEDSAWHNIVVTTTGGTGGTISLYIDGVLRSSSSNGYSQNLSVLTLLSNSWTANRRQNSNAYLDDVLAYNYGMGITHVGHLNNITSSNLATATSTDWVHHAGVATLAASSTVAGLYASADTILNSGVTLTVASGNVRIAGRNQWVQGGGSLTSGTSTLTVYQDDTALTDASFNGASIVDNGDGAVSLVKDEGGLLRLRSRQTYTGSTTVNGGTLRLEHGAAGLGTSASRSYVVNAGATLAATVTNALAEDETTPNAVTVNAGGTFLLSGGSNTVGSVELGTSGASGAAALSLTSTNAAGALVLAGTAPVLRVLSAASGSSVTGAGFLAAKGGDLTLEVEDGAAAVDFSAAAALRSAAAATSALVKTGAGRARLDAADNNFAGGIRVDAGVLELASGATSTSDLTVSGGTLVVNGTATAGTTTLTSGTLMGSGTLGDLSVAAGATVAPGNSPGLLTVGNVTYAAGSIIELEASDFTSTAAAATIVNDYIASTGTVAFAAGETPVSIQLFSWNQATSSRGPATVFSESFAYSYDFLTADGGITYNGSSTFDASLFELDLNGFDHLYNGEWSIVGDSSKLSLVYTPGITVVTVNIASGETAAPSTDLATIASDNAFAKTGAGTLTVGAAYDFSGGSAINAGTVRLGAAGVLGDGIILIASGATLELEAGASLANALSGSGTLAKVGSGTVSLANLDAATNAVTVTGGTLALTGASSVGSLAAPAGGTLDLSGATSTTVTGALTVSGGSATLGGSTTAASVAVSGGTLGLGSGASLLANGALTVSGGAATLSGSATADSVTVSSGSLSLEATGSLTSAGALTVSGGAATVAAGSTLSVGSISVTGGTLTGNFAARNSAIATASGGTVVLNDSGTLSTTAAFSGAGTVEYAGGGTLTLGATNTLTGTLKVSSGTLKGSVAGSFGSGTVEVVAGGALDLAGISRGSNLFNLSLAGTGVSNSGAIFNSGSVVWGNSGIRNVTLSDNATLVVGGTGEGSRFDFRSDGTLNLQGNILTKSGTGLFVLRSTPGSGGAIEVAAGNMAVEDNFSGAGTSAVAFTVRDGAGLGAYNGRAVDSAVTLQGTGAVLFSTGATRSTWSNVILSDGGRYDNSARVYGATDGLVITGMSGTGNFVVSGGGQALYARGTWNFADGQVSALQLNSGYLEVSGGSFTTNAVLQIGSGADSGRAVDIWAGNMTVRGLAGGTGSTRIVSNNGQRLFVNTPADETYTFSGVLANSTWASTWMGLTKQGAGTQILAGSVTTNADLNVNGGVLRLTGSMSNSANTTNRALSVAREVGSTATFEVAGGTMNFGGSTGITIGDAGTGTFTLSSGSVAVGSGAVWLGDSSSSANGTLNIEGGTFTAASGLIIATRGTGAVNLTGGTATFASVQFGHAAGSNQTAGLSLGAATLVAGGFSRAAGTGSLSVDGGTIRASGSSATYLQGLSLAEIKSGGLTFDTNGFDITVAQDLLTHATSTGGALTKSGAGILTLSGTNTYTGGTLLNAGTLVAGSVGALGTGAITLAEGTTLTFANGTDETLANLLTGSGALTKSGAGTLTLNGSGVGFSGAVTVGGGTVVLGRADALGSGAVTVSGGVLDLAGYTLDRTVTVSGGRLAGLANASADLLDLTSATPAVSGSIAGTLNLANKTVDVTGGLTATGTLKGANATFSGGLVTLGANAVHAPGDSPGSQTFEDGLAYGATSTLQWEIELEPGNWPLSAPEAGTNYDFISVTGGSLTIAAGATLEILLLDDLSAGFGDSFWDEFRTFQAISYTGLDGAITGAFTLDATDANLAAVGRGSWDILHDSTGVSLTWTPVPEPSTYGLMLGALALAGAALRRRKKASV